MFESWSPVSVCVCVRARTHVRVQDLLTCSASGSDRVGLRPATAWSKPQLARSLQSGTFVSPLLRLAAFHITVLSGTGSPSTRPVHPSPCLPWQTMEGGSCYDTFPVFPPQSVTVLAKREFFS